MQTVFDTLELDSTQIQYVFLFGSRIYNTHSENSDYDLMMITKPDAHEYYESLMGRLKVEQFVVNSKKQFRRVMIEHELYNVSLYSYPVFLQLLHEHCVWLLFAMYSSVDPYHSHFKSQSSFPFNQYDNSNVLDLFTLRIPMLRISVLNEVGRTWQKAYNRIVKENDLDKGRKLFVYSFRYLYWAMQLASKFRIFDYQVGNDIHREVMEIAKDQNSKSLITIYTEYEKRFKKPFDEQIEIFKRIASHKESDDIEYTEQNALRDLLHFIRKNRNVECLTLWFSIHIRDLGEDLVQLVLDPDESSFNLPLVNLCNGLVLNKSTLTVVALPFPDNHPIAITSFEFESERRIKHNTATKLHIYKRRSGTYRFVLYNYQNDWKASCRDGIESQEFFALWDKLGYTFPDSTEGVTFIFDMVNYSHLLLRGVTIRDENEDFRELSPSEIRTYISQKSLNWTPAILESREILAVTIDETTPLTSNRVLEQIDQQLQGILKKDRPIFDPDMCQNPLAISDVEYTLEQNGHICHKKFSCKLPASLSLSTILHFLKDTTECYYLDQIYFPKNVIDAVFDLARYSIIQNGDRLEANKLIKDAIMSVRPAEEKEGNPWTVIHQLYTQHIQDILKTLEHLHQVYDIFQDINFENLDDEFEKKSKEKGVLFTKQNDYLRCTKGAVYFVVKQHNWTLLQLLQSLEIKKARKTVDSVPSRKGESLV